MKRILFVIGVSMLIFGCVNLSGVVSNVSMNLSLPQAVPNATSTNGQIGAESTETEGTGTNSTGTATQSLCSPSYSFTAPKPVVLSGISSVGVTARCAANKEIFVFVNGARVGQTTISGDPATHNFDLPATVDGTNTVTVKSDGTEIYSANWTVSPIGYTTTTGIDNDQISVKNWKAVAFNVERPTGVKKVSAYLKTFQTSTLLNTTVVADIRLDSGGSPGNAVATTSIPITNVTMTPNWVYFPMDVQLQKGRYWLVIRIEQPPSQLVSDTVSILYVTVNKLKPGNANNKKMDLLRNDQLQVWEQTTWQTLSYDRNYAFAVSANG